MTTGNQLIARFEKFANPQLAEKWDHVGLQIGNPDLPITRLMTTLDVRPEVVDEAMLTLFLLIIPLCFTQQRI